MKDKNGAAIGLGAIITCGDNPPNPRYFVVTRLEIIDGGDLLIVPLSRDSVDHTFSTHYLQCEPASRNYSVVGSHVLNEKQAAFLSHLAICE